MLESLRLRDLTHWLSKHFAVDNIELTSLTGDAGFRQYYRFTVDNITFIAVDAPGDKSNNPAFLAIQQALSLSNIQVPDIVAVDLVKGFFCLSDFGDNLLSNELSLDNMHELYTKAIELLPVISSAKIDQSYTLPEYDRPFIEFELSIFSQWLLNEHLGIYLSEQDNVKLLQCFEVLIINALEQPQVTMHRDFHSRNIMMLENNDFGIIDFQDAVHGPITYDIVSLLRDCYIRWPEENIQPLFTCFCELMIEQYQLENISISQWQRWFDLMGVQRHIKASGIFARLFHRDQKSGYLDDIPLTLSYLVDVCAKYPELSFLSQLIQQRVNPALLAKVTKDKMAKEKMTMDKKS